MNHQTTEVAPQCSTQWERKLPARSSYSLWNSSYFKGVLIKQITPAVSLYWLPVFVSSVPCIYGGAYRSDRVVCKCELCHRWYHCGADCSTRSPCSKMLRQRRIWNEITPPHWQRRHLQRWQSSWVSMIWRKANLKYFFTRFSLSSMRVK